MLNTSLSGNSLGLCSLQHVYIHHKVTGSSIYQKCMYIDDIWYMYVYIYIAKIIKNVKWHFKQWIKKNIQDLSFENKVVKE